jgi:hypothetical protein
MMAAILAAAFAAHTHWRADRVHIPLPQRGEVIDRRPGPLHCTMVNAAKYIGDYPIRLYR